ncbi:MAG TPA: response regulator, partial [Roseiflexaceae bacterium]|nr:response regulator [Roseiflexaceae bacterium]
VGSKLAMVGEHPAGTAANAAAAAFDGIATDGGNLTHRRVLVVEDDALVAQAMSMHLKSLGCEVIGPAATSDDACALVKHKPVDAAILDINLSAGTSAPVARALAGRRTPFVFVTGYSNLKTLPDDLRGQRVLCKPVDKEMLGRALREMVCP